ncbi:MAG TPA: maleylpyruvate isomerase family mycothiol-dependent enzyme [Actinomycetota bacterium]
MSVVEALAREVGGVGKALRKLTAAEWDAPTRCEPMTVAELLAHVTRGGERIVSMLEHGPVDSEPEKDAVTYFQYDPDEAGPGIVARAAEEAAGKTPEQLITAWDTSWSKGLREARAALTHDPVLPGVFGLMRLSEYLKTRVVEVTVHHLDLDDAIGRAYHPDPEALEIVGDVLRGLLGTDLRPVGIDDLRFALTGTGRAHLDETERVHLGPLAERFPLFR